MVPWAGEGVLRARICRLGVCRATAGRGETQHCYSFRELWTSGRRRDGSTGRAMTLRVKPRRHVGRFGRTRSRAPHRRRRVANSCAGVYRPALSNCHDASRSTRTSTSPRRSLVAVPGGSTARPPEGGDYITQHVPTAILQSGNATGSTRPARQVTREQYSDKDGLEKYQRSHRRQALFGHVSGLCTASR